MSIHLKKERKKKKSRTDPTGTLLTSARAQRVNGAALQSEAVAISGACRDPTTPQHCSQPAGTEASAYFSLVRPLGPRVLV